MIPEFAVSTFDSTSLCSLELSNKIPNIAQMTKTKNSGVTGLKKRGHAINSNDPTANEVKRSYDVSCYLKELLLDNFHVSLDKILAKDIIINAKMVINDHTKLSDMFLKQVDLNLLSEYFNKSTWKKTKTFIDTKIEHCYCPICSQVCLESSIECDKCKFWLLVLK
ncbi:hypothetical protein BpHYR1_038703 [Brachionus plicatilis]|uniref:Uncharacterized protein n=1 Tax=Brachionus plicatilis TaxID=10195 RepID=A0A3M7SA90_BRAPC|nr:hypothetical protein BpHYR1_038703 [Brachionus plicatilis]